MSDEKNDEIISPKDEYQWVNISQLIEADSSDEEIEIREEVIQIVESYRNVIAFPIMNMAKVAFLSQGYEYSKFGKQYLTQIGLTIREARIEHGYFDSMHIKSVVEMLDMSLEPEFIALLLPYP